MRSLPLAHAATGSSPTLRPVCPRRGNPGYDIRGDAPPLRQEPASQLGRVAEAVSLRKGLQLLARVVLDLPDALDPDGERPPDRLQRVRTRAGEPEAILDDFACGLRQRIQSPPHVLLAQV